MNLDVDLGALSGIASDLKSAGKQLDQTDIAGASVDAGDMSATIRAVVAVYLANAATVAEAFTGVGGLVTSSRTYYQRVDAEAQASFEDIAAATKGDGK